MNAYSVPRWQSVARSSSSPRPRRRCRAVHRASAAGSEAAVRGGLRGSGKVPRHLGELSLAGVPRHFLVRGALTKKSLGVSPPSFAESSALAASGTLPSNPSFICSPRPGAFAPTFARVITPFLMVGWREGSSTQVHRQQLPPSRESPGRPSAPAPPEVPADPFDPRSRITLRAPPVFQAIAGCPLVEVLSRAQAPTAFPSSSARSRRTSPVRADQPGPRWRRRRATNRAIVAITFA